MGNTKLIRIMAYIEIGKEAPDFIGIDQTGKEIKKSDYTGKKLILYFYPKDNTPGCTAEACNLRDYNKELKEKGFEIVGVSADTVEKHKKFVEKHNLNFPLIADTEKEIIKAYGAWGEKNMFGKKKEGILRTTYVIDEQGKVEKLFKKVKTKEHSEQILEEYK